MDWPTTCIGTFVDSGERGFVPIGKPSRIGTPSSLAASAGVDTTRCEYCNGPLDDEHPWMRGLDGCAIHNDCLSRFP
jgi:hypothetical protein